MTGVSTGSTAKEISDLRAILDITRSMGSELDLDRLLNLIITETTRIMEADRSSLFIHDRAGNELWTKIAEGLAAREIRLPVNNASIVGAVTLSRRLMNIPDAYACELFNRDVDRRTGYRTRSILTCPLLNYREETVGVIQVLNKRGGGAFTPYDEELVRALATSAALAIERTVMIRESLDREKLKQELRIAHDIQTSLLPKAVPEHPAVEVAGYSAACDETGGDYYDMLPLAGGRLGLVVGDISGHGIGAALLMATGRAFLKALLRSGREAAAVFADLNDMLAADMDDSRFMTMFFGVIGPDRVFTYVSAGHEPPLLFRPSTGAFTPLESTGMVLGMLPEMTFDQAGPLTLAPGDVLVIFTDGITEAMDPAGGAFGGDRLQAVIRANAAQPAAAIMAAITGAVTAFRGAAAQRDDITLMAVKVR
ncbi:MAG: GAF domain-containing SpoIIE family protein phosphatase [Planctomycetota bacterium]